MNVPVPSGELMRLSVGSADPEKFLSRGRQSFYKLLEVLSNTGLTIEPGMSVLEWGCGCGRIARHFAESRVEFYGIDINDVAIEWCATNLKFGTFTHCSLLPPTGLPSSYFDVIYAGSVLTHLSVPSQLDWMQELFRLLKQNGRLLLTFHGAFHIVRAHLREEFSFSHVNSGLFAEIGNSEGSNNFGAYETREALHAIFFPFRERLHLEMHDILGGQDTIVLEKACDEISENPIGMDAAWLILKADQNTRAILDLPERLEFQMLAKQTKIVKVPRYHVGAIEPELISGNCTIERILYTRGGTVSAIS